MRTSCDEYELKIQRPIVKAILTEGEKGRYEFVADNARLIERAHVRNEKRKKIENS